jgi:O-antigen biosynthesis protein
MNDHALSDNALFPERFVPEQMHGLIEVEHLGRYAWASRCAQGRRVLDAGCGVGYGSLLLHAAGAVSVSGVDIAQEAIDAAEQRAGHLASFAIGDISALSFEDASFDLVVCFEAIEHVVEQERALDELRRVLTPDGLLIVSSPNREVYAAGNPHHTHEYTPEELRSTLAARFANVRLERQQAWLTGLICDDETLGASDPTHVLVLEARKVSAVVPGSESFTFALASDVEIPMMGTLATLTDLDELSDWRERVHSAEAHLEDARNEAVQAGRSYESIRASYESLMETYESLMETHESLVKNYARATDAIETIEEDRAKQAEYMRNLTTALDRATEQSAELQARIEGLERDLDRARATIAASASSDRGRITDRLRALAQVWRR